MKMIVAPHGLQDGLVHPLAQYSFTYFLTSADLAVQTSYTNVFSEAQYWGEAQCDAQYLYPQACLVDQRYYGIIKPICSI